MAKKLDFSYLNDSGKKVSGAAAFNHYVYTEKGGVQGYNDEVGAEYVADDTFLYYSLTFAVSHFLAYT